MKKYLISILVGGLAGYVVIFLYAWYLQPANRVWFRLMEQSEQWEKVLRQEHKPCYILVGGSEISFSVNPEIAYKEEGLCLINASSGASAGLLCNAEMGLRHLHPGDTMILSILTLNGRALTYTTNGLQLALKKRGLNLFSDRLIPHNIEALKSMLQGDPGGYVYSLTGFLFPKRGTFKYLRKETQLQPSGWMALSYDFMRHCHFHRPYVHRLKDLKSIIATPPESTTALASVKQAVRKRGANLCAHLPVGIGHDTSRVINALKALKLIRLGIPVLKDTRLGVCDRPELFADSTLHMKPEAANENTRIIARALKKRDFWTEQELVDIIHAYGWNEDGTRREQ